MGLLEEEKRGDCFSFAWAIVMGCVLLDVWDEDVLFLRCCGGRGGEGGDFFFSCLFFPNPLSWTYLCTGGVSLLKYFFIIVEKRNIHFFFNILLTYFVLPLFLRVNSRFVRFSPFFLR